MVTTSNDSVTQQVIDAAVKAVKRGWQPIPIRDKTKMPGTPGWTRLHWENTADGLQKVHDEFAEWAESGFTNLGILLGEPSGGLVDVDLDHPKTNRLKRHFLPPTGMMTGRPTSPASHYWYVVEEGTLPGNRRHKMPDGSMAVELRANGSQTLIPPSTHPSGEEYTWDHTAWGEPAVVNGHVLTVQVALLALGTVLIDNWPQQGGRHEAYLALAGGILRNTDGGVHPYWERNLEVLIRALADATHDEDGPETRVDEVMGTTLKKIKSGDKVAGFGVLGDILGKDVVRQTRVLLREVESAAGYTPRETVDVTGTHTSDDGDIVERAEAHHDDIGSLEPEERDPLQERLGTWQPVDLDPYIAGKVRLQEPEVLSRDDGKSLMYHGRVNMLYGPSESAKSWIALYGCLQEMAKGERVVYIDFEDEPINTLERLRRLGAGADDVRHLFNYIRPEDPLAPMQRNRWGADTATQIGEANLSLFEKALADIDPSLIVADGMTVLYGLHGLDTNDSVSTDVITTWLKSLTRNGRSTVVIIDHVGKGAQKGAEPIGSQHKTAMVQGTLIQAWPIARPMPGKLGEIELIVTKDRPGKVRQFARDAGGDKAQVAAKVIMDSRVGEHTDMRIEEPGPSMTSQDLHFHKSQAAARAAEAKEWEERVLHAFEGVLGKELGMPTILDLLSPFGDSRSTRAAVMRLVDQGWLEPHGKTKGKRYRLVVGAGGYEAAEKAAEEHDEDDEESSL